MEKKEMKLISGGVAYSIIANLFSFSSEFWAAFFFLFGLLAYLILVYIGIKFYKMNDKSIYFSVMSIIAFNVLFNSLTLWFFSSESISILAIPLGALLSLIVGYLVIRVSIKIVRYFTEEIKTINESY